MGIGERYRDRSVRGRDHATSVPSWPVLTNRRTCCVSGSTTARLSRSALMKPSFYHRPGFVPFDPQVNGRLVETGKGEVGVA